MRKRENGKEDQRGNSLTANLSRDFYHAKEDFKSWKGKRAFGVSGIKRNGEHDSVKVNFACNRWGSAPIIPSDKVKSSYLEYLGR